MFLKIIKTTTTLMHKSIIFLLAVLFLITGCSTSQTGQVSKQEIIKPTPKSKQFCFCRSDRYNCNDFKTNWEAQEAYECCMEKVGYDVHQLDGDLDGRACEW